MKSLFSEKNFLSTSTVIIAILLIINLFILRVGVEDNGSLSYTLQKMNMYDVNAASGSGFYSNLYGVEGSTLNLMSGNIVYSIVGWLSSLSGIGVVSVYIPAVIFSVIFIIGTYLLLKKIKAAYNWNNLLSFIMFAIILCDIGYISYMNTPYTYSMIVAFLPIFIYSVLNLCEKHTVGSLVLELLFSLLLFNSNVVLSVIGIIYGLYSLRFIAFDNRVTYKVISILCSVVIIVSNLVFITNYNSKEALYNSCFYGALLGRNSSAVVNLPQEYEKYIGVPAYEDEAQQFINSDKFNDFKSKTGYKGIITYYAKNPKVFLKTLKDTAMNGTVIKIDYLGNYSVGSKHYSKQQAKFWGLYNIVKRRLFPTNLFIMIILFIAVISLSFNFKKNYSKSAESKFSSELLSLSALSAIVALLITPIIFGQAEINFNLFVFNILTDITVLFSIIGGTRMLFIKRTILTTKYGVNQ